MSHSAHCSLHHHHFLLELSRGSLLWVNTEFIPLSKGFPPSFSRFVFPSSLEWKCWLSLCSALEEPLECHSSYAILQSASQGFGLPAGSPGPIHTSHRPHFCQPYAGLQAPYRFPQPVLGSLWLPISASPLPLVGSWVTGSSRAIILVVFH